jgi:hypothetical protein
MPTALERSGQYGQDTLDQGAKLGAPHAGQDRLGEQFGAALIGCRVGRVPRRLGAEPASHDQTPLRLVAPERVQPQRERTPLSLSGHAAPHATSPPTPDE